LNSEGVEPNFTLFTGEEFMEKTKPHVPTDFVGFPTSREATVEGYVSGMTKGN
jgi:hypothetical protein